MKLEDILNHPPDEGMVFEGEEMHELLGHLAEVAARLPYQNSDPKGTDSTQEAIRLARRIRLSPVSAPPSHGIAIAYMVGRHWTYEPKDCKHDQFRIGSDVTPVMADGKDADDLELAYYSASIRINCQHCGDAFEWVGLPHGFSPYQPTVSIDGQELRISAMPPGKSVQPGLPGFKVTRTVFDEKEAMKQ